MSAWDRAEDAADLSLWGKVLLVAAILTLGLGGTFLVLWVCP